MFLFTAATAAAALAATVELVLVALLARRAEAKHGGRRQRGIRARKGMSCLVRCKVFASAFGFRRGERLEAAAVVKLRDMYRIRLAVKWYT